VAAYEDAARVGEVRRVEFASVGAVRGLALLGGQPLRLRSGQARGLSPHEHISWRNERRKQCPVADRKLASLRRDTT